MLTFFGSGHEGPIAAEGAVAAEVNWIDAFDPTPDELRRLAETMGARIPSFADLSEIESSSRLSSDGGALIMSMPASMRDADDFPRTTPIGFVVTRDRLATIRFAHLPSFEHMARTTCGKGELSEGGLGATVSIMEMIVDQLADVLERIGGELDAMSHQLFTQGLGAGRSRRPQRANALLAKLLREVGASGDFVSKVSESLLGLSRMVPFLTAKAGGKLADRPSDGGGQGAGPGGGQHGGGSARTRDWMTPDLAMRLDTVAQDARSLRDFEEHLASKTQFLLDTLLGLANIEQNNVFRVLTVVSVVGIPPTFFASLYGMNFHGMPELDWRYGYAYGLTVITLSGLLPAIWFKVKGWW